jgi:metal-sulfur cluster biosynthetic enzyme
MGVATPDQAMVMGAMRDVIDPELGIDAVELGMVGDIEIDGASVLVNMRLTSMSCPFWDLFAEQVRLAVGDVEGVSDVRVQFDRRVPWSPDLMTDAARRQLQANGLFPLAMGQPREGTREHTELLQLMRGILAAPTRSA